MRLAAIDLGTVTSRLLVADVEEGRVRELERQAVITHLGEGVDSTGLISAAALAREVDACQGFMDALNRSARCGEIFVQQIRAVATSAMRDAANASLVLAALSAIGIDVEVIAGEREAHLSFAGTLSGFPRERFAGKRVISVDIGGGSTELVCGSLEGIYASYSFNIGSRRVTERFLCSDPPTYAELSAARIWIRETIAPFFTSLRANELFPEEMLAVAGTATTAVTVAEAIEPYDPVRVHGAMLSRESLSDILQRLIVLPLAQRSCVVGLEAGRAPVIVGGLLVLDAVLEASGLDSFTISETDILHGILLDTYEHLMR